jgi:hypothetical protein
MSDEDLCFARYKADGEASRDPLSVGWTKSRCHLYVGADTWNLPSIHQIYSQTTCTYPAYDNHLRDTTRRRHFLFRHCISIVSSDLKHQSSTREELISTKNPKLNINGISRFSERIKMQRFTIEYSKDLPQNYLDKLTLPGVFCAVSPPTTPGDYNRLGQNTLATVSVLQSPGVESINSSVLLLVSAPIRFASIRVPHVPFNSHASYRGSTRD